MAKALPDGFPPCGEELLPLRGHRVPGVLGGAAQLSRQDALEQHIVSEMLPASGCRILDLGCGYGRLAPCYLDRFDEVVLCDGSLSLLRDAQAAAGSRAILVAADVARLPFKAASFDCVLTIRVLQHVHDFRALSTKCAGSWRETGDWSSRTTTSATQRGSRGTSPREGMRIPSHWQPTEPLPTLISRHPNEVESLMRSAGFSPPEYQGTALVHPLMDVTDRVGRRTPAGARWAPFMGRFRLAPWLIGKSFAQGADDVQTGDSAVDLFRCPVCHADLVQSDGGFGCSACGRWLSSLRRHIRL